MRKPANKKGCKSESDMTIYRIKGFSVDTHSRIQIRNWVSIWERNSIIVKIRESILWIVLISSYFDWFFLYRCLVPDRGLILTKDGIEVCARWWVLLPSRIITFQNILFHTCYRSDNIYSDVFLELSPKSYDRVREKIGTIVWAGQQESSLWFENNIYLSIDIYSNNSKKPSKKGGFK